MNQMLRPELQERPFDRPGSAAPVADLRLIVRDKVIPRLREVLERTLSQPRHPLVCGGASVENDISFLAACLLGDDMTGTTGRIDALRRGGKTLSQIYLQLLVPTAFHLRDLWSSDIQSLGDVTIAFCNLRSVLHCYASEFYAEVHRPDTGLRALLVAPSQKGSVDDLPLFGVLILSEFFRRDGWDAWTERSLSSGHFRDTVLSGWFDLVEVLATSEKQLDEIASGIRIIRRGSPNPAVGIIVSGDVFRDHPEFVRLVGADLVATDALSSLSQAKHFVTRLLQRPRLK